MAYIGNNLQVANENYRLIDDISSGFDGVTTTFALQVNSATPVPFPTNPQQCLISVNGVIQEPDPTGTTGFNLVGTDIVFSAAPTGGHAFFGVILAGADYITVGSTFPDGSVGAPSITFRDDLDTGFYRSGSGTVGYSSNGVSSPLAFLNSVQTWTAAQSAEITTLVDGATITPDLSNSNNFTVTLGGSRTIANPTNIVAGQTGSIFIVQDGTGSRTLSWGSYWSFIGGTAPTLTAGVGGAVDRVDYICRTTTDIQAVFTANYS